MKRRRQHRKNVGQHSFQQRRFYSFQINIVESLYRLSHIEI